MKNQEIKAEERKRYLWKIILDTLSLEKPLKTNGSH